MLNPTTMLIRDDARGIRARTGFSIRDCVEIAADDLLREHDEHERELDEMSDGYSRGEG